VAKGKGVLKTFWITPHAKPGTSNGSSETGSTSAHAYVAPQAQETDLFMKKERLIDWMVELLQENIKKVVARRNAMNIKSCHVAVCQKAGRSTLDEVVEIIELPAFDEKAATATFDSPPEEMSSQMVASLRDFVATVSNDCTNGEFRAKDSGKTHTQIISATNASLPFFNRLPQRIGITHSTTSIMPVMSP
jgi:hypothetical protein